ncbi:MAG: sterol desaturase family protein [Roseibium sp.]|uniref:sterol desaturase family protein n=1 Tax=Roseibium sp. TaxID=1936156 RepID=UPI001B01A79A|nr:sterol desaturase family protein [Roseibium sp.]MBO6891381.1 sterol desaturase family protein [Roseibium sp.]MBO6929111.1 sterol desaturase family protein [Roseibium sp.]
MTQIGAITTAQWSVLLLVAVLGHLMALFWYCAKKYDWRICQRTIYDLPTSGRQTRRELKNSIHTPLHAVLLLLCLAAGLFQNSSVASFWLSALGMTVWAEIWHYFSHRAFHLKALHWIHAEHHKSRLNTPFTAISFSFTEKLVFDLGLLIPFAVIDQFVSVNFFGISAWFIGYLIINSFSHANFEFRASGYNKHVGKVLTTTTYHALHHSRYTGNYGLGTRVLDRLFGTEWEDYEALYSKVNTDREPLSSLKEKVPNRSGDKLA